jgi:hypothetical protein
MKFVAKACGSGALLLLLLSACGGGSGGVATVPAPVVSLAGTQVFRDAAQVIVGTPVALSAGASQAGIQWRIAQHPDTSSVQLSVTSGGAAFTPDAAGTYVIEAKVNDGSSTSEATTTTISVIPDQIEFTLDVVNSAGQTALWIRPVHANAPMSDCVVYAAGGCTAPSSVAFFLDGVALPAYQGITTTPSQYMWWHPLDTAPLVGPEHVVTAVVTAPGDPAGGANRREAMVKFTVSSATQTDPFGGPPAASVDAVGVPAVDAAAQIGGVPQALVGTTVAFTTTTTHALAGLQRSFRFVEVPANSAAAIATDATGGASFFADRVGTYTIECTPVFADGRSGTPAYATTSVTPQVATIVAVVVNSTSPNALFDDPPPAPGVARISASATSSRGVASLEVLLDGAPVPPLQIQRFSPGGHGGSGAGTFPATVYDITAAALAQGPHAIAVRMTDSAGRAWELPVDPATTGGAQTFEDPNP